MTRGDPECAECAGDERDEPCPFCSPNEAPQEALHDPDDVTVPTPAPPAWAIERGIA